MASVSNIFIYPEKGEPGQELDSVTVTVDGLDGDRRKKSPVHLVTAADYVAEHPRANLVLDLDREGLAALLGRRVRIGEVELDVTSTAGTCTGVYAVVPLPGTLSIHDRIMVLVADH